MAVPSLGGAAGPGLGGEEQSPWAVGQVGQGRADRCGAGSSDGRWCCWSCSGSQRERGASGVWAGGGAAWQPASLSSAELTASSRLFLTSSLDTALSTQQEPLDTLAFSSTSELRVCSRGC